MKSKNDFTQSATHFDFGPPNEVKERLHRSALQRLSGLTKALTLFLVCNINIVVPEPNMDLR
jgi:hypothetical protein